MLPRPLVVVIAVLVTLAWAVNVVIGFVFPERYDTSLNAIFAVVVGAVFALGRENTGFSGARKRLGRLIAGDAAEREHGRERERWEDRDE